MLGKITILEIKSAQMKNKEKLLNIETKLKLLNQILKQSSVNIDDMQALKQEFKLNDQNLWDIEDKIRINESSKEFDSEYIELARSVYIQNDKRAATKRIINQQLGSSIIEEKYYAEY